MAGAERMSAVATVKRRKRMSGKKMLITVAGWSLGLIFIAPYLEMILTALKPKTEITAIPATYLPSHWTWHNFVGVWKEIPLATYLKSSFIISLWKIGWRATPTNRLRPPRAGKAAIVIGRIFLPGTLFRCRTSGSIRGLPRGMWPFT